jgi:hypothetical protein
MDAHPTLRRFRWPQVWKKRARPVLLSLAFEKDVLTRLGARGGLTFFARARPLDHASAALCSRSHERLVGVGPTSGSTVVNTALSLDRGTSHGEPELAVWRGRAERRALKM